MKVLIILASPKKDGFNHAIAKTTIETLEKKGHEIIFHDLYEENFDGFLQQEEIPKGASIPPIIDKHCSELTSADGIIVIHPNWWGQPPAVMKNWIDRVFRPGVAYEFLEGDYGEGIPKGLLKAKQAVVFNTANTTEEREIRDFGDPLELIWKKCIFNLCGVKEYYRRTFSIVVISTPEQREQWLKDVKSKINELF